MIFHDSYVDRGNLDQRVNSLLNRSKHIALKGESKCGKSWLRQKTTPKAIVVQCRLQTTPLDIYTEALAQLDIEIELKRTESNRLSGNIKAAGELGLDLLGKVGITVDVNYQRGSSKEKQPIGKNLSSLSHVSEIILKSKRRLVIEDFHYLKRENKKELAFDLKAFHDWGLFITIIGIWHHSNMLTSLNKDLLGRVEEISIHWNKHDLGEILNKGAEALNIIFEEDVANTIIDASYSNAGLLQELTLSLLDECAVYEEFEKSEIEVVGDSDKLESAAMKHAEQLERPYINFSENVSKGIRKRENSTAIYAYAMKYILESDDDLLINGIKLKDIYEDCHSKEPRIQQGNLRKVLRKIEKLQVDEEGRGLVIAYDDASQVVYIVDRQLLFFRRYSTIHWPWEELIKDSQNSKSFEADDYD